MAPAVTTTVEQLGLQAEQLTSSVEQLGRRASVQLSAQAEQLTSSVEQLGRRASVQLSAQAEQLSTHAGEISTQAGAMPTMPVYLRPFHYFAATLAGLVVSLIGLVGQFFRLPFRRTGRHNATLITAHLAKRNALIDHAREHVPRHDSGKSAKVRDAILTSDIIDIVSGIAARKWTASTVAHVYIHAAIRAHEQTNCLTEINFAEALKRAEALDSEFEKTGKVTGPLHGVPFSLKDQYSLKGKHSTIGYSEWLKKTPEQQDCAFAQAVQHLGAVCIAKTNVPQTMFSFECRNPLWGQTSNPHNSAFTCGGSSGGEAALLACGGAAFGYGSDIGGSLRIPTGFCGIYALKPSNGRTWPRNGNVDLGPRPQAIESVAGPMCRSMKDLDLLMRLVSDLLFPAPDGVETQRDVQKKFGMENRAAQPLRPNWLDPLTAARQRKASGYSSKRKRLLRIGYYSCDGVTMTSPASLRAVDEARRALSMHDEGAAIELVEINPALLQTVSIFRSFAALNSINKYKHLLSHVGKDPIDQTLALAMRPALNRFVKHLVSFLARVVFGDTVFPSVAKSLGGEYAQIYFEHEYNKENRTRDFERRIWDGLDLDAIICPVQAGPALPHYGSALLPTLAAATIIYNVLGNPVVVTPVTYVDAELDRHDTPSGKDSMARQAQHAKWTMMPGRQTCSPMVTSNLYKQYNAATMAGLPVGVQVVAREYEDETAVGVARLLDDALAKASDTHRANFGPGTWERRQAAAAALVSGHHGKSNGNGSAGSVEKDNHKN